MDHQWITLPRFPLHLALPKYATDMAEEFCLKNDQKVEEFLATALYSFMKQRGFNFSENDGPVEGYSGEFIESSLERFIIPPEIFSDPPKRFQFEMAIIAEAIAFYVVPQNARVARDISKATRAKRVYFIQAVSGGPIKIGVSNNPEARRKNFQTGSAEQLVILGTRPAFPLEPDIHALFASEHIRGELFSPSARLLLFIEHFCIRE